MVDYVKDFQCDKAACGEAFPEIASFFDKYIPTPAKVLDLGCGQGRDSLVLARKGHTIHGVDLAKSGIDQMLERAKRENLCITGEVSDIRDYAP